MQERTHPHIDEPTRILLEVAENLIFYVTPGDIETTIMVDAKHRFELLNYVEIIWKDSTIIPEPVNKKVYKIRIIKNETP